MRNISKIMFTSLVLVGAPAIALADDDRPPVVEEDADEQENVGEAEGGDDKDAPPTATGELPKVVSDDDAQPEVASGLPPGGLVTQAGVGGTVGYGRAGVLELGGSAGFAFASDYREMNFSPTVGYFIADNLEISAILSAANIKAGGESSTLWSALIEPSYHVPFNRTMFGFFGLGLGGAHVSGMGTGFATAPRVGANFMVGRSSVLTPSLSYQYTTISSDDMDAGNDAGDVSLVALTSAVRFNVGYTAMW